MPTRTSHIRSALTDHLDLFADSHRKMLLELLTLAEVGERARDLIAGLTLGGGAAAPAKRAGGAKRAGKAASSSPASSSGAATVKAAPTKKGKPAAKAAPAPKAKKAGAKKAGAKTAGAPKKAEPGAKSAAAPRPAPKADQPPLREILVRLLKESATPLSVKEIEKKVLATGYASSSSNFAKVLSVQLSNLKEGKRVDKGVYALKEPTPAT